MTFSISFIVFVALILFGIGYVIGVCKEKTKWWKVFHVIEPEDWSVLKKWEDPDVHDEYAEAYLDDEVKQLKGKFVRQLIFVISLIVFLILVGIALW